MYYISLSYSWYICMVYMCIRCRLCIIISSTLKLQVVMFEFSVCVCVCYREWFRATNWWFWARVEWGSQVRLCVVYMCMYVCSVYVCVCVCVHMHT